MSSVSHFSVEFECPEETGKEIKAALGSLITSLNCPGLKVVFTDKDEVEKILASKNTAVEALTDADLMGFGKHKDEKIGDVPASYLLWLFNQPNTRRKYPRHYAYIEKSYKLLVQEDLERLIKKGVSRDAD